MKLEQKLEDSGSSRGSHSVSTVLPKTLIFALLIAKVKKNRDLELDEDSMLSDAQFLHENELVKIRVQD